MKNLVLLALFSAAQIACGGPQSEKTGAAVNAPPKTVPAATTSATLTAESPLPSAAGEKVERPQTVRFPIGAIPSGWQWIDPDGQNGPTLHEMKNGRFVMKIPTARDLYGENLTAPRLLKAITGDFQIETRLTFDPKEDYQGAGLVIYVDGQNYLRFERSYGGLKDGGSGIRIDVRKHNEYESITTPGEIPTTAPEVELKITRRLDVYSFFWRDDESGEWRSIEDVATDHPNTIQAGIIGCNTATEIMAEFTYIRLSPQPVTRPF
jgi:beta-xylosidase